MNSEIKMSVSSFIRKDGEKSIFVLFSDKNNSVEFALPECRLIKNNGFSQEDINSLLEYIKNEQDYIYQIAKKVNPMKGFLGQKQGE